MEDAVLFALIIFIAAGQGAIAGCAVGVSISALCCVGFFFQYIFPIFFRKLNIYRISGNLAFIEFGVKWQVLPLFPFYASLRMTGGDDG